MSEVRVELDTSQLQQRLQDQVENQIPYAASLALSNIAGNVRTALIGKMGQVFDRPTPYTLNSLYVKRATKQNLEAQVRFKDATSKGTPASKYLSPEVTGGARSIKRVERALSSNISRLQEVMSRLGMTNYFVPGAGAQLDGYGNMVRGQFAQILSQLGGQNDRYANETPVSRDRREGKAKGPNKVRPRPKPRYFIAGLYRARHLAPGIWVRVPFAHGWAIKPVLIEAKAPPEYAPRLPFFETAETVFNETAADEMRNALASALGSAR
ncbi:Phage protein [Paraburkholderia tropica]